MRRVQKNDGPAMTELWERWHLRLCAYLYKRGASREMADRIAVGTLTRVWEKRNQFNSAKGNFAGWVYRICYTMFIDAVTHQHAEPLPADIAGAPLDPNREQLYADIQDCITQMTNESYRVFLQEWKGGIGQSTQTEIAETLECGNAHISQTIKPQALKALGDCLGFKGYG
jgi:DNA-directed RNA polymerase specialized sigma24 family protein